MKKKIALLMVVASLILTGFTIVDYDEYREPSWVWRDRDGYTITPQNIKSKVEKALKETQNKGLLLKDFTIYISPYTYFMVNGMALDVANSIIIAHDSYNTIYHEFGHIYSYHYSDKNILTKYQQKMKEYYPDHTPKGSSWETSISEDFAEEFKMLFTGTPKRTDYPNFPNFYEWLLRNTQPIEITRQEVFDKLGGTEKLIEEGIVIGNEHGDYMLSKPISRAEVATILVRIKRLTKEKRVPFTDIKNQWYSTYVMRAYNEGLIKGLPDNTFGGENLITRYELHMILERL